METRSSNSNITPTEAEQVLIDTMKDRTKVKMEDCNLGTMKAVSDNNKMGLSENRIKDLFMLV